MGLPSPRPELTAAEREQALAMRAAGRSWNSIAAHYGVRREWIAWRLDPEHRERRREHDRLRDRRDRIERPPPAPVAFVLSPASRAEARRLHRDKHLPLTHIAAALRMPYREVIAAIEGSRAP